MFSWLKKFGKEYRWEIFALLLVLFVVFVNRFPEGYVIAGEDTFQYVNLNGSFKAQIYDWQGRVFLFYAPFYLLDSLGVSESAQLSWYLGLFLIGSFLSFRIFFALIFGKERPVIAVASSLFYALNLYTLYIFTYSWGYSHYQVLYVFIPILVGAYIEYIRLGKPSLAGIFLGALFLGSSGFSNPAFAVSSAMFFFLLTSLLFLTRLVVAEKEVFKRIFFLVVTAVFVSAYWILPTIPQVKGGIENVANTSSIDLTWWLQKTSNPISETLRLGQFNSNAFFPFNNPYEAFPFLTGVVAAASFLPILFVIIALAFGVRRFSSEHRRYFFLFFGLFILFIALNARVRFPFDVFNSFLFHLPGLNTLRSYEKIAIFTPFLLTVLVTMAAFSLKVQKSVLGIFFLSILLLPLPFYFGKLQQNMSFILSSREKDFQESTHSFLVKIPREYYEVQDFLNSDTSDYRLAALPYNSDKVGWVSYPVWKMRGSDITQLLYKAPLLSPNTHYFAQWLYAKDFNEKELDPIWLPRFLGLVNVKYIFYHKDVHERFFEQSQKKIKYLEEENSIEKVSDNDYFTLYKILDEYVTPRIYLTKKPIIFDKYEAEIVAKTLGEEIVEWNQPEIRSVHRGKMEVSLKNGVSGQRLVLNEQPSLLWRASLLQDGKKTLLRQDTSVVYANAWFVPQGVGEGVIRVEYLPIKFFFIGVWITGVSVLIGLCYCSYLLYGKHKKHL